MRGSRNMFVSVEITNIPPDIDLSYSNFEFGIFGVGCWVYGTAKDGDFEGEVEWVNRKRWRSSSPGQGAKYFRLHLKPGIRATVKAQLEITGASPDVIIDAVRTNLMKGLAIPPKFPP